MVFASDKGFDNDGGSVLWKHKHLGHEPEGFGKPALWVGGIFQEAVGVGAVKSTGGVRWWKCFEGTA